MATLITNATLVTMNAGREVLRGSLLVEGGRIAELGAVPEAALAQGRVTERIDASGLVALPGLIQTHVHLCQTLFRNLAEGLQLLDWLKRRIWPFEAAHTPSSLSASARLGLHELLRGGTTTVLDMGTVHHTETIFQEAERAGLRLFCGKAMMDQGVGVPAGLCDSTRASVDESVDLLRAWHGAAGGRLRYAFAPRFVLSCSRASLEEVAALSRAHGVLVHTHASENPRECEAVRKLLGADNIEFFRDLGLAGPRLSLAHCVWPTPREIDILAETGTRVTHCPGSNLKLASGLAPVPEYLAKGICVSLGADGAPCNNRLDLFDEMRLAGLLASVRLGPAALPARRIVEMATLDGARALGVDAEVGSLERGKRADIVLLDLGRAHVVPGDDLYAQLVYSARSTDVRTVLVDGRVVVRDGRVLSLDEGQVVADARAELARLLERAEPDLRRAAEAD
ncbi:MAG: 5'-deoxyadenosine deaminase [Planctomycetes bacterium]|nr:5'-deoxyadenosine deaminase [Planctomycetota bacterium]